MSAAHPTPGSAVRSNRAEVRNPMLKLPEVRNEFDALPPESRAALVTMLRVVSRLCRENAVHAYKTRKPPMFTYWQGLAVNTRHLALAGRTTAKKTRGS